MFKQFKPTWMIESIYDLTPAEIRRNKIKLVLTDLDNTLIAWNNPNGTAELKEWLQRMQKAEIPVVVVSNNNEKRVKKAVEQLGLPFISRAMKPFKHGIKIAQKRYNVSPDEMVLVGDQLMTDVLAANRSHMRSILVRPIVESDAWNTKINRFMEAKIKKHLAKKENFEIKWGHSLDE